MKCSPFNETYCLSCRTTNLFLENNTCVMDCNPENSTFPDPITQTCVPCHSYCKKCFGSGPLKCTECNDTYFYLADGCYLTCPVGLFGNQQDKLCTQCDDTDHSGIKFCAKCDNSTGTVLCT